MKDENLIGLLKYTTERSQKSSAGNRDKRFFAIIRLIYLDNVYGTLDYIYDNRGVIFSINDADVNKISRELIKKDLNLLVNENMLQKIDGKYYPFLFTKLNLEIDKLCSLDISNYEVSLYFKIASSGNEYELIKKQLYFEESSNEFTNTLISKLSQNEIINLSVEQKKEFKEKLESKIKTTFRLTTLNYQKTKQILFFSFYLKRGYMTNLELEKMIEGLGHISSKENKASVVNYLISKNPLFVFLN